MAKSPIAVVGVPAVISRLKRLKDLGEIAAEDAVNGSAEILLREANKICPIDTGDLRESGTILKDGDGFNATAAVVYEAPYAVYVHENLEAFHQPPTQAKWLEETWRRYRRDIGQYIQRTVRSVLNRR